MGRKAAGLLPFICAVSSLVFELMAVKHRFVGHVSPLMWFAAVALHGSALGMMLSMYRKAVRHQLSTVFEVSFAAAMMVVTWSFDVALLSQLLTQ